MQSHNTEIGTSCCLSEVFFKKKCRNSRRIPRRICRAESDLIKVAPATMGPLWVSTMGNFLKILHKFNENSF